MKARARHRRTLVRGLAATVAVGAIGTAGVLGATALRGRSVAHPAERLAQGADAPRVTVPVQTSVAPAAAEPTPAVTVVSVVQDSMPAPSTDPSTAPTITPSVRQASALTKPVVAPAPLSPILSQGETVLPEGVVALRTDSSVTLSFDTPETRTRMPEKFERFLRTTLPQVYGQAVDSVLAKVPDGGIARQGDIVLDLPTRGIRIPVKDAWTLAVYPETRPGHDGPLVVRYRVTMAKD